MIPDGRYTIVYSTGEFRSIGVKRIKDGQLSGKTILFYKTQEAKWKSFAFLLEDNTVQLFRKFAAECSTVKQEAVRKAVAEIAANPDKARRMHYRFDRDPKQLKLRAK